MLRTHKQSGWTREPIGYGNFLITPTDNSGIRKVAFMSAGSWANLPNDRREDENKNRVVLIDGNPLPEWAMQWLNAANDKAMSRARASFRAMLDQADWDEDRRNADAY